MIGINHRLKKHKQKSKGEKEEMERGMKRVGMD